MPVPSPGKNEDRKTFVSRCISAEVDAGRDQKQAAAICYDKWRGSKGEKRSADTGKRTIKFKK